MSQYFVNVIDKIFLMAELPLLRILDISIKVSITEQ